jgi:superoxide dismutase, Fe-Mn family
MTISLKPLPFSLTALEPHISTATVELHHERHEGGYVERVNSLVANTPLAALSLEELVCAAHDSGYEALFNAAAQAWNHSFYWSSLRPGAGGRPHGAVAKLIDRDLGGYDRFVSTFNEAATAKFGSGWAWLVLDNGHLRVTVTADADRPRDAQVPLLAVDVWEHAYYLDYQYRRAAYVAAVTEHLLNWDFANEGLRSAGEAERVCDDAVATVGERSIAS